MPTRPPRPCRHPGCPRLTSGGYCMEHAQGSARTGRPSAHQRGYTSEWRRIRRQVLDTFPLCRLCGARATEVDHITPLRLGGTHDLANLQPLCASCHRKKTSRQMDLRIFLREGGSKVCEKQAPGDPRPPIFSRPRNGSDF